MIMRKDRYIKHLLCDYLPKAIQGFLKGFYAALLSFAGTKNVYVLHNPRK